MILIRNLRLAPGESEDLLPLRAAEKLKLRKEDLTSFRKNRHTLGLFGRRFGKKRRRAAAEKSFRRHSFLYASSV